MKNLLKIVFAPLFSITLVTLGSAFFITFITLRLKLDGNKDQIGFIQSAYYLGILLGAVQFEGLIRRIGHIRAFTICIGFTTASLMLQGWYVDPYFWSLMRMIAGICLAGIYVVIESWLLDKSTISTRGQVLSLYMLSLYISQSLSQYFLALLNADTKEPFFLAGLLCSLATIPIALTKHSSPELHTPTLPSIRKVFSIAPVGFYACLASGLIISSMYSYIPYFAEEAKFSVSNVTALTILGGALLQWPIGKLSDIINRRTILMISSFGAAIPVILIMLAHYYGFYITSYREYYIITLCFLLGGFTFALYPLGITYVCDHVEQHNITAITGVLLLTYGIGATIGPYGTSFFVKYLDVIGFFLFVLLNTVLLGMIVLFYQFIKEKIPTEEQQEFVPLPRSTSVVYDLDPRIPEDQVEESDNQEQQEDTKDE